MVRRRPYAARHHERHHPGDKRERRHQNRPQPVPAGLDDGVMRAHPRLFQLIGVIDLQNRVLLDDAEEHEQPERGEDVERLPEDDEREQRERQRQRERQQNRDRVDPGFELRCEHEVHEDERERERGEKRRGRARELARLTAEPAAVVRTHVDRGGRGGDLILHRALRRARQEVRGHRDLPLTRQAPDVGRRLTAREGGDILERHHPEP